MQKHYRIEIQANAEGLTRPIYHWANDETAAKKYGENFGPVTQVDEVAFDEPENECCGGSCH